MAINEKIEGDVAHHEAKNEKEAVAQEVEEVTSRSPPPESEDNNPYIYHKMSPKFFMALTCMSFLWVGSQIPLYMFGSVMVRIYSDIGGTDRYTWFVIGYLIPNAALCPFVGALSDLFGRRYVAIVGQVFLIIGPIITSTAKTMNIAIAGQVFSGIGAGTNELIALAATGEMVPVKKRGLYVGLIVFTILPFCPSVVWAQLIWKESSWRHNGILVGVFNAIGLILCIFCYKDRPRVTNAERRKQIIRQVDYVGGFTSTVGVLLFMMGMQWGASQYAWTSVHVLVPFIIGAIFIIGFFVWEVKFAPFPMCPPAMFSKARRTVVILLLITFFSGGNFFALLLFWPTQIYNVYGDDPIQLGLRSLPIGFGIILGAIIALLAIPLTKGRVTAILVFSCALMTAGTGAMSISNPSNIAVMYVIVSIAALGVGGVLIPSAIIAQIATPSEYIATITAITLAIRYVGGAIAFTAYDNIFLREFTPAATKHIVLEGLIMNGIVAPDQTELMTGLVGLVATAQWDKLRYIIATSPAVFQKDVAFDIIVKSAQKAFADAYRYPYWMSIAFGSLCFVLSFFLQDLKKFMTDEVAVGSDAAVKTPAEMKDQAV